MVHTYLVATAKKGTFHGIHHPIGDVRPKCREKFMGILRYVHCMSNKKNTIFLVLCPHSILILNPVPCTQKLFSFSYK